jgi:hypothetical protein
MVSITERLRKLAMILERDDTPSREDIRAKREEMDRAGRLPGDPGGPVTEMAPSKAPVPVGKFRNVAPSEVIKPTARPQIKPTREISDVRRDWKKEDVVDARLKRQEYQRQYRQDNPEK